MLRCCWKNRHVRSACRNRIVLYLTNARHFPFLFKPQYLSTRDESARIANSISRIPPESTATTDRQHQHTRKGAQVLQFHESSHEPCLSLSTFFFRESAYWHQLSRPWNGGLHVLFPTMPSKRLPRRSRLDGSGVEVGVGWKCCNRVCFAKRRAKKLRAQFGPEYNRAVDERGSRYKAEAELERLEKRVRRYSLHPLSSTDRDRFQRSWRTIQAKASCEGVLRRESEQTQPRSTDALAQFQQSNSVK
jgi:hypothetical protein